MFDGLGWKDRQWAQKLGRTSVDLMFHFAEMQLEANCSLILDNSFDPSVSTPRFQALKARYGGETIQIVCDSDQDTLFDRFRERTKTGNRHPGHGDDEVLDELRAYLAREQSLKMDIGGRILTVATTDFANIDYQALLHQVEAALTSENGT